LNLRYPLARKGRPATAPAQLAVRWRRLVAWSGLWAVLVALSGCGSLPTAHEAPTETGLPLSVPSLLTTPALDTLGLVAYAASMQGKPYRIAGASPAEGFDCSGLVQHVFGKFNLILPRSSATMAAVLPVIPLNEVEAADLLFFNTQGARFSHVGIYLGDGRFVHAPSAKTGRVIISKVQNAYWQGRVTGARRPQPLPVAFVSPASSALTR